MIEAFKSRIVANSVWLLAAQALTKVIALGYNIFLARALGPTSYGLFVFGLTLFGLAGSLADFGLGRFLTREAAKRKEAASQLTSDILQLTALVALIAAGGLTLAIYLFDSDRLRVVVAAIMILTIFPNSLAQIINATFTALEKMRYVAVSQIFLSVAIAILSWWGWMATRDVKGVAVSFLFAHFAFFFLLVFWLLREKIRFRLSVNLKFWRSALKAGIPYAILAGLGLVYFRVDSLLLVYLRGETETGFYGAAYRFVDAAQFIPVAVSTAIFPTFAKLHEQSIISLKIVYLRTLKVLFLAGVVVGCFLFAASKPLVNLIYGDYYTASIPALQILSLAIVFQFIHVPGASLLFASHRFLRVVILLSLLTVGFNILANLILIPIYGFLAAAAVTVASELISFIIFFGLIWLKVFQEKWPRLA